MLNATYKCKKCGGNTNGKEIICPHCGIKLSDAGRDISVSVSDLIKTTDEVFREITSGAKIDSIKWDSNNLALIGILLTLFTGFVPLLNLFIKNSFLALLLTPLLITIFMILITKVRIIKRVIIQIFRWLLQ